jgi:hypothetical protein
VDVFDCGGPKYLLALFVPFQNFRAITLHAYHAAMKGDEGQYHLFVAQMKTGGLIGWGTQSECVHATSAKPEGELSQSSFV